MDDHPSVRVLLIDDEEMLLEYMSKRLLKKGFTVKCAFSGEEAVKTAQQAHFDVAVVDLKMPGMDGVETQKRLHEIQPFLQCIVLTGHGSIDSALESGQQDAFRYLLKPLEYDTLVTSIHEAYERKVQLVNEKFQEEVEEIHRSGLGAKGIKKAIDKLREKYGIQ
jgi:two-component system NtrC family response regulator